MIVDKNEKHIFVCAEEGYELIMEDTEPFEFAYLPLGTDLSTIFERLKD